MDDIKWLFFDLGGVLLDETAAWEDRIRRTCDKHGISADVLRSEMEKAARANLHEYKGALEALGISFGEKWNSESVVPYPEAAQVLSQLRGKYRLGIIANQPINTRKRMEEWRLAEYFDLMLISAEVGFSKPDARLFKEALYKAQISAEKCVMIGDKLTNDSAPAKALGFKTVWIKQEWGGFQTIADDTMKPDIIITDLVQLKDIFAGT